MSHRLSLLLDGDAVIVRGTSEVPFRAGDFYFHDPLRPYGIRTGSVRVIGVGMPEALLPLPRGRVDAVLGRLVPGRHGMGTLLARFLSKLTADTSVYQPSDGPRLGTVLGDLVAALCTQAMADGRSVPPGDCGGTLAVRIEAFIQQHLREAELTPRTVAAAHGISPSYLHRLFQEKGETVAASIRRQRLERARYDLADPAQDGTPVAAVAARWGFPRATDFARAFRAAYGITPTEYRKRAHEGHGSQAGHAGQEGRTGHDGGGRIAT